jgi:hypothetical protein
LISIIDFDIDPSEVLAREKERIARVREEELRTIFETAREREQKASEDRKLREIITSKIAELKDQEDAIENELIGHKRDSHWRELRTVITSQIAELRKQEEDLENELIRRENVGYISEKETTAFNARNEALKLDREINLDKKKNDKIKEIKTIEIMDALRKFANKDNLLIIRAMYGAEKPLTLAELREKTGLKTNDLNHGLVALRNVDIAIKEGNTYILTQYGAILIRGYNQIESDVTGNRTLDGSLFDPMQPRWIKITAPHHTKSPHDRSTNHRNPPNV